MSDAQLPLGGSEPQAPESPAAPPQAPPSAAVPKAWHEMLEDPDLKGSDRLKAFKTADDVSRSLLEAEKYIRSENASKKLPSDFSEWSDDQWKLYDSSMGIPEEPTGYGLEADGIPEGMPWDANIQSKLADAYKQARLTPAQAKILWDVEKSLAKDTWEGTQGKISELRGESVDALRKEWGAGFEGKMAQAKAAFGELAGDIAETIENLPLATGQILGDHPVFIRLMANMGHMMSEDGNMSDTVPRRGFGMTPEEAQGKIADIEQELFSLPANATQKRERLIAERQALYNMADPDGVVTLENFGE